MGIQKKSNQENMSWINQKWLQAAIEEAKQGLNEGGLPIGSVLIDPEAGLGQGRVVGKGHNRRVQNGDPTAHGEMECIRNAGRRTDWHKLILVSTLSPCPMCTGTAMLYKIPRIVVGENVNYKSPAEMVGGSKSTSTYLEQNKECIEMMANFTK